MAHRSEYPISMDPIDPTEQDDPVTNDEAKTYFWAGKLARDPKLQRAAMSFVAEVRVALIRLRADERFQKDAVRLSSDLLVTAAVLDWGKIDAQHRVP